MIWKMAIPKLSIMVVEIDPWHEYLRFQNHNRDESNLTGILRTCRESRRVVKAERPCQLPTGRHDLEIRFHPDTIIYITNFSTVITERNIERKWTYATALQGIKYLAVPSASPRNWFAVNRIPPFYTVAVAKVAADVKQIILVRYDELHRYGREKRYINLLAIQSSLKLPAVKQGKDGEKGIPFYIFVDTLPTMDR